MFTGITAAIGTVTSVEQRGDLRIIISCPAEFLGDAVIGASIACSGCCLTVVERGDDWFAVDVSGETVQCTAPGQWTEGRRINLERSVKVGDELGGHIVTGHVDGIGQVQGIESVGDSNTLTISLPADIARLVAAKGAIAVDGVSLTVNSVADSSDGSSFTLNIIPHTAEVTTLGRLAKGDPVNLEIDILARYLARMTAA